MNKQLWTRDFTTIIVATALGCLGGVAGSFALSFMVFEQTGSTLASAVLMALQLIPGVIVPVALAPWLDRLPRKPFLVGGDLFNALVYFLGGWWLKHMPVNYGVYVVYCLVLSAIGSVDQMAYNAIYPKLIPKGMEEKGYAVSSMLYPVIATVMTPLAAVFYNKFGGANILLVQGVCSLLAAVTESRIQLKETVREGTEFSFRQWWGDLKEAAHYLKKEKGIRSMITYSSITNGFYGGMEAAEVAFFSTAPGFNSTMYSFFTVANVIGRTIGGTVLYRERIPKEKKYGLALFIYLFYDTMDVILLWLPFPAMLVNRACCGFLGIQSGTLRYAAIQKYIPDEMRARFNGLENIIYLSFNAVLSLFAGYLGDHLPYPWVLTICSVITIIGCFLTIVRNKQAVEAVYLCEGPEEATS